MTVSVEKILTFVVSFFLGFGTCYGYIQIETRQAAAMQQGVVQAIQVLAPKCMEPFEEKRKGG